MTSQRIQFVDNVRTLLIALVVFVHAAVTYGGEGGWYYVEPTNNTPTIILLTLFNALNQAFFMSLLFLLAGYFTAASATRATLPAFVGSRVLRLAIPLAFFYCVLGPLTDFISMEMSGDIGFQYSQSFHAGPMWFAQALLIFTAIFLIGRSILKLAQKKTMETHSVNQTQATKTYSVITSLVLFIALLWFTTIPARALWPMGHGIAGMQLGSFGHYIAMYFVGVFAYNRDWNTFLKRVNLSTVVAVITLGVAALPVGMALGTDPEVGLDKFMGGTSWQAIFYAAWESTMCVMLSLLVLKVTLARSKGLSALLQKMGRSNYAVYIIHPPILLLVSWLLMEAPLPALVKFVLSGSLTLLVCFPLGYALCKIRILKNIL